MQPFSRHAGFFASLKQVEDRLAAEQPQHQPDPPPALFSDTMTASPLFLGTSTATATDRGSGPALEFLTLSKDEDRAQEPQEDSNNDDDGDDDSGEEITRLMSLLGLSPPPRGGAGDDDASGSGSGGCDCSGGDGFMAKVVGVVGPKCDREKSRVDGWIRHYCPGDGGGCREPGRLAHLLLAKASWTWDGEGPADRAAIAFPSSVKEFLARDAPPPPPLTKEGEQSDWRTEVL